MRLHLDSHAATVLASLVCAVLPAPAPPLHAASPAPSPYAGEQSRGIKALSAQEVEALLAGQGMGFAKAAELNGYPGPAHVLELAGDLELTGDQRRLTVELFAAMEREAVLVGRELVDAERRLDRLFAERSVEPRFIFRRP